jgi:uncharacterized protein
MSARIIVFAKAPVAGRVKTRLGLPPEASLRLHDAFVRATLAMLAEYPDVEISTDAATEAWRDIAAARSVQAEGGLGERLLHAVEGALSAGREAVVVLGSDSPTLPGGHVDALLASGADVAFGPAEDGGFWGICCRRSHPAMFDGVEWSSSRTLETARGAMARCGLSVEVGPEWFDIDEPTDLERLRRSGSGWGID